MPTWKTLIGFAVYGAIMTGVGEVIFYVLAGRGAPLWAMMAFSIACGTLLGVWAYLFRLRKFNRIIQQSYYER